MSQITRYFNSLNFKQNRSRIVITKETNPSSFDYDGKQDELKSSFGEGQHTPGETTGRGNNIDLTKKYYFYANLCLYLLFDLAKAKFTLTTRAAPSRYVTIHQTNKIPSKDLNFISFPVKVDWYRWEYIFVPVLHSEEFSPTNPLNIADYLNTPNLLIKRIESALKKRFEEEKLLP